MPEAAKFRGRQKGLRMSSERAKHIPAWIRPRTRQLGPDGDVVKRKQAHLDKRTQPLSRGPVNERSSPSGNTRTQTHLVLLELRQPPPDHLQVGSARVVDEPCAVAALTCIDDFKAVIVHKVAAWRESTVSFVQVPRGVRWCRKRTRRRCLCNRSRRGGNSRSER